MMIRSVAICTLGTWLLSNTASAALPGHFQLVPPPLRADQLEYEKRAIKEGVFQQLIDHSNPELGTFPQRFWWSDEFYDGPGSPVVFFTPGEAAADEYSGYLTNRTISGLFANATGAAILLLEHRYWGTSSPTTDLTIENLQYLTLNNSIQDIVRFTEHVDLPFDPDRLSAPDKAPWIFTGGSYSGALAIWTYAKAPGTFWAYHASSAAVEAIEDFWRYFVPVQEGMPRNCSADVEKVVEYVDQLFGRGNKEETMELKRKFGMEDIEHDDDFANALEMGPWNWQGHDFSSGYNDFHKFCDYVENAWPGSSSPVPGPEGVGLEKALDGYAKWIKEVMLTSACQRYGYSEWKGELVTGCFDSYNASNPLYTDRSLNNPVNRQWQWFLCNEPLKFWQDGAPKNVSSIVSRLINVAYWERQCSLYFPPTSTHSYGIARGVDVDDVNAFTGGWLTTDTKRVMFVNGQFDPWLDTTPSSRIRPGGPVESTEERPVWMIEGGTHCNDLLVRNGRANEGVARVQAEAVAVMSAWVDEFYEEKGKSRRKRAGKGSMFRA